MATAEVRSALPAAMGKFAHPRGLKSPSPVTKEGAEKRKGDSAKSPKLLKPTPDCSPAKDHVDGQACANNASLSPKNESKQAVCTCQTIDKTVDDTASIKTDEDGTSVKTDDDATSANTVDDATSDQTVKDGASDKDVDDATSDKDVDDGTSDKAEAVSAAAGQASLENGDAVIEVKADHEDRSEDAQCKEIP